MKRVVAMGWLLLCGSCAWYLEGMERGEPEASAAKGAPVEKLPPQPVAAPAKAEVLLRLHGSNTIGSQLAPALAAEFLRADGATDVKEVRDSVPTRTWVSATLGGKAVAVEVWAPGSKLAFESLAAGRCDVGMASRAIGADEAQRLQRLGDFTSPQAEHVLGLDGVAVVVHASNTVTRLSTEKLAQIFSGQINDWVQVGGAPGPIHVYARDDKSGTYETFAHLVLRGRKLTGGAKRFEDSAALADAVAADASGIGFVALPYVRATHPLAVQDGDAAPLYPTVFTVATEDYPLARRLRLYTAPAGSEAVRRFITFALSPAGQKLVEAAGFIPLTVRTEPVKAIDNAPEKYVKATQNAMRVSINFRFKKGSSVLDAKAFQDVESLVKFLVASPLRERKLFLFGFADRSGKEPANVVLSRQRADMVAIELRQHGLDLADVEGFGSTLPMASNDTPEGRERNRRVEVWIK
jgi:phosphate transport system substrate-binding protein